MGLLTVLVVLAFVSEVFAGPPLTNAEGVGGCALNPFAYVANPIKEGETGIQGSQYIGYPQIGIWKIGLYDSKPVGRIDWLALGANISFFNRVEVGYSHEYVDIENLSDGGKNIGKDNLSIKINLIREGDFGVKLLPAVSVGAIYKTTSFNADDDSDVDYYVVATKMFGDLPVPVMLNAGLLFTKGIVRGVLGFGDDRDTVFFGNIETVLFKKFIVGWEYEAKVDTELNGQDVRTHAMWEAHLAYMPTADLMLVVSYAYTGDKDHDGEYAFGNAYVLSLQYTF